MLRLSNIHSSDAPLCHTAFLAEQTTYKKTNFDPDWHCIQHIFTLVEADLKKTTLLFNKLPCSELSDQAKKATKT